MITSSYTVAVLLSWPGQKDETTGAALTTSIVEELGCEAWRSLRSISLRNEAGMRH
jgi:hypothetical protein